MGVADISPTRHEADGWPPWPPEIPPLEPPQRPEPPRTPPAAPILPSWEERTFERDLLDRLLEQRVVLVSGRLDDRLGGHVTAQLLLLGDSDRPIDLHLGCPDADLDAALSLAQAVELVRAPVHAVVRGTLRGPAIAVLCAATERAAHRDAMLTLSRPPSPPAAGTAAELGAAAEEHERQLSRLRDRICSVTGRGPDEVAADLQTGRVFSADEALQYGLLTRVL